MREQTVTQKHQIPAEGKNKNSIITPAFFLFFLYRHEMEMQIFSFLGVKEFSTMTHVPKIYFFVESDWLYQYSAVISPQSLTLALLTFFFSVKKDLNLGSDAAAHVLPPGPSMNSTNHGNSYTESMGLFASLHVSWGRGIFLFFTVPH